MHASSGVFGTQYSIGPPYWIKSILKNPVLNIEYWILSIENIEDIEKKYSALIDSLPIVTNLQLLALTI